MGNQPVHIWKNYTSHKAFQIKQVQPERFMFTSCSTDSDQVKVVMESCKDIMLKNNLHENGFM